MRQHEQNITLSRKLNARGMEAGKAPRESIALFREAIKADPFNGAAHNNLGVALLADQNYYEAANQFEEAIRLLPAHPDPRVNLGLVYEAAGQLRNAQQQYEAALVVSPEYLPAIQPLARVRIRAGHRDEATMTLLRTIAVRAADPAWRDWARKELSRIDSPDISTAPELEPASQPAPHVSD